MDNDKRQKLNKLNLSTPLGLLIAKIIGGTTIQKENGIYLNYGRKGKYIKADAMAIGDVVLVKQVKGCKLCESGSPHDLSDSLLRHELIHSEQYAKFGGIIFLALYLLYSIKSFLIYKNTWQDNIFEIQAGLEDGGYI
jgi:hypothetical protein